MEKKEELSSFRFYALCQNGFDQPSELHTFKTVEELQKFLISKQQNNADLICQLVTQNLYVITTESNLNELLTCKDIKRLKSIIQKQ